MFRFSVDAGLDLNLVDTGLVSKHAVVKLCLGHWLKHVLEQSEVVKPGVYFWKTEVVKSITKLAWTVGTLRW